MAAPENALELISQFVALTQSTESQARHHLEASGWNIATATDLFFEGGNQQEEEYEDFDEPEPEAAAAAPQPPNPAGGRTLGGAASRFASFDDIRKSEEPDDEKRNLYAGGDKSGLAVQDPDSDQVNRIFKKAAQPHQYLDEDEDDEEEEERKPVSRFAGSGRTLGSDDTPSRVIPGPAQARRLEIVERSLTFWRDGFSIQDGPLLRYDDPANREILDQIHSGHAPSQLMDVEMGQKAEVRVYKRMDEDYVAPKKTGKALFSGKGTRLGSPTPGVASSSYQPPAAPAPVASSAGPAATSSSDSVAVDPNVPSTAIQIRLGDGTRLRSRFNTSHTVGDLYAFVNAASTASRTRDYVLQTTMPPRELLDHSKTVEEEKLLNSVVVQKWK